MFRSFLHLLTFLYRMKRNINYVSSWEDCNLPMKIHSLYFFSFDTKKLKDGEMNETYHIGCNNCFSLYDSDFVLVQVDMRYFIGYTVRNIA